MTSNKMPNLRVAWLYSTYNVTLLGVLNIIHGWILYIEHQKEISQSIMTVNQRLTLLAFL